MTAPSDRLVREDAAARRTAQTEFARPVAVEAGAGTGKTAVLVARVVVWCLGRGWELAAAEPDLGSSPRDVAARTLEGVVAITFTEAAAGEMASRVAHALAEVAGGGTPLGVEPPLLPPEAADRARHLAAATHRLEARTIHSFCASLLRRWPVEAGVSPELEIDADGIQTEAVAFETVEQAMRTAFTDPPDRDWATLAAAGAGPDRLVGAVAALTAAGADRELTEDAFAPEILAASCAGAVAAIDDLLDVVADRLDTIGRGKTSADLDLLRQARAILVASPPEACVGPSGPLGPRGEAPRSRLEKWARGTLTGSEARALEGVDLVRLRAAAAGVAEVAADLESLEPEVYRAAARVLAPLVAAARARLVEQGLVSYDGLLEGARRLLAEHPEVTAEVRRGIRQLLVDEFQDTDRLQCEIVRRLGLEGEVRPGLFVVGDPKQSIYGWRSADLGAYEGFRDDLEAAGGQVVRLAVSFRSVPPVLAEVERIVAPVMRRRPGLQPEFQPLVASEQRRGAEVFRDAARAPVEAWLAYPSESNGSLVAAAVAADRRAAEARALVADLGAVASRDDSPRWNRMAVLLRSTSDLDGYLEALREAGIPFAVTRERSYYRQREVVSAAALIRVLLDPSDGLAQLTLLRSEAVAVPDAALLPLWRRGLPRLLAEAVRGEPGAIEKVDRAVAAAAPPADAPGLDRVPGWRDALGHAVRALAALRRVLRDQPPAIFVERARTLWPLTAVASARFLGGFRVGRLEQFWDDLEAMLESRGERPAEVARLLRRAVDEARESPVAPAPAAVENAVQVMTIHGAKGLDFDHVYLIELDKDSRGRGGGRGTGLLPHGGGRAACLLDRPSPGYLAAERERERVGRCERVRLLYVAMTRARERVVLSGAWSDHEGSTDPDRARSLLDLAGHRLAPEVARQLFSEGASSVVDEHGLRWRTAAAVAAQGEAGPGPDSGDERPRRTFDPAELETTCRQARERMARRWSGTVSGELHGAPGDEQAAGERPPPVLASGESAVAAAVGTAVHGAMEALAADVVEPVAAVESLALARLDVAGLDESAAGAARARLEEVVVGLARGRCLGRWRALAPSLVARELPLLIPPRGDEAPLGFVTGVVDLVAAEASTGELVVVDFKTDAVAPGRGLEERAGRYRAQVATYARALRDALELETTPAAELWFLAADEIVRFDSP